MLFKEGLEFLLGKHRVNDVYHSAFIFLIELGHKSHLFGSRFALNGKGYWVVFAKVGNLINGGVFLRNVPQKLYMVNTFDQVPAFGSSWSWDWYNFYYATERSALPIHGNVIRFAKSTDQDLVFTPDYFFNQSFKDISSERYTILREKNNNNCHLTFMQKQEPLA